MKVNDVLACEFFQDRFIPLKELPVPCNIAYSPSRQNTRPHEKWMNISAAIFYTVEHQNRHARL